MAAGSPHSSATEERRSGGSWLAAQGRLPLAFMGLALGWLAAGTAMLVSYPGVLTLPHVHPHVVALVHAWVLGIFVTAACGAVYQIAPVALGTPLWKERDAWWHFFLHAAGVPGMVWMFWRWDLTQVGHFGTLVALGIALFAHNIWRTVQTSHRTGLTANSLRIATLWLGLAVSLGLTVTANHLWGFLPVDPLSALRMHAHAGLAGFFITLLQGATFQLVPMFTLGTVRDWRLASRGFWISQIALMGLLPALLLNAASAAALCGVAFLTGCACSAVALRRVLQTRKKQALDPGVRALLGGGAVLLVAAATGVALVWPGAQWGSDNGGLNAMVYGVLVILGGLLPCFAGILGKIVPFLTWMQAYGPQVGRVRTPAATALGWRWAEQVGLALLFLALVPLLLGTWRANEGLLTAGAWTLMVGVALFLTNMIGVLRHLWLVRSNRKPARPMRSP